MYELSLIPLVKGAATQVSHSALPASPIVPGARPSRIRLRAAGALRRLATRLDHDHRPAWVSTPEPLLHR